MLGLRLLVGVLLFSVAAGAFGFFLGATGVGLWLLIGLFGTPAALAALLVFGPLEDRLQRSRLGRLLGLILSLLGALFALLIALLVWSLAGGVSFAAASGPWMAILAWTALGALWGGLWALSGRIAQGLRPAAPARRRVHRAR